MSTENEIVLSEDAAAELLQSKSKDLEEPEDKEREAWSHFSLSQALRGMEDEKELYSLDDLKEAFDVPGW